VTRQWQRREGVTSRIRLRDYDYASPNTYFVTLCTAHRARLFGDVRDGEMILSPAGLVVDCWWGSMPAHFSHVVLDAMVVMPNHLHGILMIVPDYPLADNRRPSLSEIMRWFKSHTTGDYALGVRLQQWPPFDRKLWQPRFYDHIVRNDRSLERIREYIAANPSRWPEDEFNDATSHPGPFTQRAM
jgi:putative transposase